MLTHTEDNMSIDDSELTENLVTIENLCWDTVNPKTTSKRP